MQSNMETTAAAIALAISGWTTWIIIGLIAKNFICALFCSSLARAKGYSELTYFLLGILFGELVLLYMVGMPLSYEEERSRQMQLAVVLADAGFVDPPESDGPLDSDETSQTDSLKSVKTPLGDLDTSDFDSD